MAFDATFWALIGLLLFFGVVLYFKVPALVAKQLDARSTRIRNELDEARALKDEAKRQLAEYQRRRQEAEADAEALVEAARREAEAIVSEARQKNEDYVTRRTAMAEQKIAQAEADAIAEVRASAVDIAVAAASRILAERGEAGGAATVDRSIQEVRSRLN